MRIQAQDPAVDPCPAFEFLSRVMVRIPRLFNSNATAAPMTPAPMIIASAVFAMSPIYLLLME